MQSLHLSFRTGKIRFSHDAAHLLVVRWAGNVAEMEMCNVVTILPLVMGDELMGTVDDLGNMAPHHRIAADLQVEKK